MKNIINKIFAILVGMMMIFPAVAEKTNSPYIYYNGRYVSFGVTYADETVWYTLDGSDPSDTSNSARKTYDGTRFDIGDLMSVDPAQSLYIRAVAKRPDWEISEEMELWSATYYANETKIILKDYGNLSSAFGWLDYDKRETVKNLTIYGRMHYYDFENLRSYFSTSLETLDLSNVLACIWGDDESSRYLPNSAFSNMSKLTTVKLPDNLTRFDNDVFNGCTSLKSVNIPKSLTLMDWRSFMNCSSLTEVILPEGLTQIHHQAFEGCTNLKNIVLPASLRYLGGTGDYYSENVGRIFYGCTSLEKIVVPNGVTEIFASTFEGCTNLKEVVLPNSLTNLGGNNEYSFGKVFKNCSSLESITIPVNISIIYPSMFEGCSGLKTVVLSENLLNIDEKAFAGCSGITELRSPRMQPATCNATSFDAAAFSAKLVVMNSAISVYANTDIWKNFTNVEAAAATEKTPQISYNGRYITLTSDNPTDIIYYTIDGTDPTAVNSYNEYMGSVYIDPIDPGNTRKVRAVVKSSGLDFGPEVSNSWTYYAGTSYEYFVGTWTDGHKVVVTEPGKIETALSWCENKSDIRYLRIDGEAQLSTSDLTFIKSLTNLERIDMGNMYVENNTLLDGMFYNNTNLYAISVPQGLTAINASLFENCSNLYEVRVPYPFPVTSIGYAAFAGCANLSSFILPNEVRVISDRAFEGCKNLTSISNSSYGYEDADLGAVYYKQQMPDSLTTIGAHAFDGCANLESLLLPNSLATIGGYAFQGCSKMIDFVIPSLVTTIPENAFYNCVNLRYVTIPTRVTYIGAKAFGQSENITKISVTALTPPTCDASAFESAVFANASLFVASDAYKTASVWSNFLSYSLPTEKTNTPDPWNNYNGRYVAFRGETGTDFWYTTDNSDPSDVNNGARKLYSTPFDIGDLMSTDPLDSLIIRVVAIAPGKNMSDETRWWVTYYSDETKAIFKETNDFYHAFRWADDNGKKETIKNITIYGNMGWNDFANIRNALSNNLESIDMSNVQAYDGLYPEAFSGMTKLTTVILPKSGMSHIYSDAFSGCTSLKTVEIPSNVRSISENVFKDCASLESITLPSRLSDMATGLFTGCKNLKSLYVMNPIPPSCYGNVFDESVYETATLYVAKSSIDSYKSNDGDWRKFKNIASLAASTVKPEVSFDGNAVTLSVPGDPNAEIYYTYLEEGVQYSEIKLDNYYEYPFNVWNLGEVRAMARSGNTDFGEPISFVLPFIGQRNASGTYTAILKEVGSLAKSLAWLEDKTDIVRLTVRGPINQADFAAFKEMPELSVLDMKEAKVIEKTVPDNAFAGSNLTSVYLPDDIETIGASAFKNSQYLQFVQKVDGHYEWVDGYGDKWYDESYTLPETLKTIGASAFEGCIKFNQLTKTPANLTTLGAFAFKGCSSWESIIVPKSLKAIEESTYYGCIEVTSVSIPSSVATIGKNAFGGCEKITALSALASTPAACADESVFASAVYTNAKLSTTKAAGQAYASANVWSKFANSGSVKETNTPRVYISTDSWASNNDYDGQKVSFSLENGTDPDFWYTLDGTDPSDENNAGRIRFSKPVDISKEMIAAGLSKDVKIRVAAQSAGYDVSAVYDWTPEYFANDTLVILKKFDGKMRSAFQWTRSNDSLRTAIKEMKVLGNMTWEDFSCLRDWFGSTLKSLDLSNVQFYNEGENYLSGSALSDMKFKEVKLPENLVRIEGNAFENCDSLLSIVIPNSVKQIRPRVFLNCKSLKNITLPESLEEFGYGLNYGTGYRSEIFKNCTSLESVSFPANVRGIYAGTFEGCTNLKKVDLPANMYEFGDAGDDEYERKNPGRVFKDCKNLVEISLPIGVTSIPENTFYGCEKLATIKMSNKIETIASTAFAKCTAIEKVHMIKDMPPTFSKTDVESVTRAEETEVNVFEPEVYDKATLVVLSSSINAYSVTEIWKNFKNIETAGTSVAPSFSYDGHYMTLLGDNPYYEFYYTLNGSDPVDDKNSARYHYDGPVDIGDTVRVRAIGRDAYLDFGGEAEITAKYYMYRTYDRFDNDYYGDYYMVKVGQTDVLDKAFEWLDNNTNYNNDDTRSNVKYLKLSGRGHISTADFSALKNLPNIVKVDMSAITEDGHILPAELFQNRTKLEKVVLPSSIMEIGDRAFSGCISLSTLSLPAGLQKIGDYAFENCLKMGAFNVPNNLTNLGEGAFSGCSYLTSWTIPNGVNEIKSNTFRNCSNMTSLSMHERIKSIGESSFENCAKLSSIKISNVETAVPSGITTIPRRAYYGCSALTSILDISDKVTVIGDSAFYGCSNVTSIFARSFTPAPVGVNAFAGIEPENTTLFISQSVKDAYAAADGWKKFVNFDWLDPCSPAEILYDGRYLTFKSSVKNPTIYFTLDGSDPVEGESMVFDKPYDIGQCGVRVRTLVTKANVEPSKFSTDSIHYYFDGETATVDTIGVLHKAFDWCEPSSVENLTIKTINNGKLSSTELTTLHKDLLKNLSYLDISEAEVEGNALPDNAFEGAALIHASLPKTLTSAGSSIFKDCNELAAVTWNAEAAMPDNAMNGVTNPNLLFYAMNKSYVPSSITKNIVVNAQSDNVVLCDVESGNNNFYCPTSFTASNISYTHNYTLETKSSQSAGWETISLPFTVQSIAHEKNGAIAPFAANKPYDQARPFWLNALTESGFVPAAEIKANTPYIISMPHNESYATTYDLGGNVTFSAKNATIAKTVQNYSTYGDISLIPTTMTVAKSESVLAINREKKSSQELPGSVFVADDRDVRPFEAYAIAEAVLGNAPAVVSLSQFGGTTDIEDIMLATGRQFKIYVVDGVLYISSDVRQTVRIFNASGALVREVDVHAGENPVQGLTSGMYVVGDNKIAL